MRAPRKASRSGLLGLRWVSAAAKAVTTTSITAPIVIAIAQLVAPAVVMP